MIKIIQTLIGVGFAVVFGALVFSTEEAVWRRRRDRIRWALAHWDPTPVDEVIRRDVARIERAAEAVHAMFPHHHPPRSFLEAAE